MPDYGRPKRHLARSRSGPVSRAACGLKDPPSWTRNPAEVTCKGCRKTVYMADAQVAVVTTKKNKV